MGTPCMLRVLSLIIMAQVATLWQPCSAVGSRQMAQMMKWNSQPIPYGVALQIGWNLPADVVGAGVYGGIAKRDGAGRILVGDEWPESNLQPPAHNPVHATGPFLDFEN